MGGVLVDLSTARVAGGEVIRVLVSAVRGLLLSVIREQLIYVDGEVLFIAKQLRRGQD